VIAAALGLQPGRLIAAAARAAASVVWWTHHSLGMSAVAMNFTELDGTTREWMLRRFEAEESGGNPYRSEALSQPGLSLSQIS